MESVPNLLEHTYSLIRTMKASRLDLGTLEERRRLMMAVAAGMEEVVHEILHYDDKIGPAEQGLL